MAIEKNVYLALKALTPEALEEAGLELYGPEERDAENQRILDKQNLVKNPTKGGSAKLIPPNTPAISGYARGGVTGTNINTISSGAITAGYLYSGTVYGYTVSNSTYQLRVKHPVPKPECTCGFYAYHSVAALNQNKYNDQWVGVIRAYGRIVIGEKGLRAQKAEVVALVPTRNFFDAVPTSMNNDSERERLRPEAEAKVLGTIRALVEGKIAWPQIDPDVYKIVSEDRFQSKIKSLKQIHKDLENSSTQQTYSPDSKMSYVDFNMLYLSTVSKHELEQKYVKQILIVESALIESYLDVLLGEALVNDEARERVLAAFPLGTGERILSVMTEVARQHPKAMFFNSIESMLAHFPLTGADDFMPSKEEDVA
jgi:hypothetical protein